MSKQFPLINVMSPPQQRKAIKFLKTQLALDDTNPGDAGYNDHPDTTELRCFLIEVGAVSDRRKARGKCK